MTAHLQPGARWDKAKVAESLKFLEPQQAVIQGHLTELLNSYNNLNKSAAYYDLVCGEWLMHFTQVVYAAYRDVSQDVSVPLLQNPIYVFADYNDYLSTSVQDPLFGEQLRQQIARLVSGSQERQLQFAHQICILGGGSSAGRWKKFRSDLKKATLPLRGTKNAPFVICRPNVKCSSFEWWTTQLKWRHWARQDDFDYPIEITSTVNAEWRRNYAAAVSVSTFSDIVHALLPLYIPVVYLEAFLDYRQKSHALDLHRPKALYTANSLHGHTLFKMLAADWREEGTKLLNHQHGGGYGIDLIHPIEDYETRVVDRFYTLGWRSSNDKQVPLAGALSASRYDKSPASEQVLLMCVCYPRQVYRLHFQPMAGTIETMITETASFVGEMKERQKLLVRPYFNDYGWNMVNTLRQADPGLVLDDLRISGIKLYQRASLVVHNYLGTSWLETLAMNIPTVCFYDNEIHAFRAEVQPYIDRLAAVGILHQSGSAAARFVLSVKHDPQGWWQQPEVQDARLAFVKNYANYSSDWATQWEQEFRNWID